MAFAEHYLAKHKPFTQHINEPPAGLLSYIVVIPVYLEEEILQTLESLSSALSPKAPCEVITVVNYAAGDSREVKDLNLETYKQLLAWNQSRSVPHLRFYSLLAADLPKKSAGAGYARKIGMDEALYRFNRLNNTGGLILSLDADSLVDSHYFLALESALEGNPRAGGCIIDFAHPLSGEKYDPEVYEAIAKYELHMRYYKHALAETGFPWPAYTIGSCFGVRAGFYAEQGGMNRRKAGEDFYFLNKLLPHRPFIRVTGTTVQPSPRPSQRVPFGTGPAVRDILNGKPLMTYHPESFSGLKSLFSLVPDFYGADPGAVEFRCMSLPGNLKEFLKRNNFSEKVREVNRNTTSYKNFYKRFFQWFDAFMVIKYLNQAHRSAFRKLVIEEAARLWLKRVKGMDEVMDVPACLSYFRNSDVEVGRINNSDSILQ